MNKIEYILTVLKAVASKATCPQSKVGAIFTTVEFEILATGYNGAPRGLAHCKTKCSGKCQTAVHAEANAIIQAAKMGHALRYSELWVTRWPCEKCAMMLINLGICSVISNGKEHKKGMDILKKANINMFNITNKFCFYRIN